MSDYDTYTVFGAVYAERDAAEADFEAVKTLYDDWDLMDDFDAAILAKDEDGKVKIVKTHETATRRAAWQGAGLGLATGAVIALFPAAAIGSGLLAATTGGGAILGALAGHVSKGMDRGDLKDLGEQLDEGEVGLIVIAATDVGARVEQAIANARELVQRELKALRAELEEEARQAREEAAAAAEDEATE